MDIILNFDFFISLITLTVLEIVLGVDNIIVIAILCNKLPEFLRRKAQLIGLSLAMIMRILLLLTLNWISHLIKPLFTISNFEVTGRDIVLLVGGLFLIYKALSELIEHISCAELREEHEQEQNDDEPSGKVSFTGIIVQIILIDIVFSLDSVITAIGIANQILVMILAVILAVLVMMVFANAIAKFIDRFPALKVLALTFLVLVGIVLTIDGLHYHLDKTYIYAAMAFSLAVVFLNIWYETNRAKYLKLLKKEETTQESLEDK